MRVSVSSTAAAGLALAHAPVSEQKNGTDGCDAH
jgi:hypothetical protein